MASRIGTLLGLTLLLILPGCGGRADTTVGELVSFDKLEDGQAAHTEFLVVELEDGEQPEDVFSDLGDGEITSLPPLEPGYRRFAFIDPGCAHDSAQLVVEFRTDYGEEQGSLDAQLLEDGGTEQHTDCGQAVYFLSVFDVSVRDLPDRLI